MKESERLRFIDQQLDRAYPQPKPALRFGSRYQLLVAVILSAQCTDKRVNLVTKKLFADCPGPKQVLALGVKGLIPYIRSCGLFNSKSSNIIAMTKMLVKQHKGRVPGDFEKLVKLPGVGEKTAGVVLAQGFGQPAFPVDTHIFRVSHRLALTDKKTPNKVSADLKQLFPKKRWRDLHLQMVFHGRRVCFARKPNCGGCPLLKICPAGQGFERSREEGQRRVRLK